MRTGRPLAQAPQSPIVLSMEHSSTSPRRWSRYRHGGAPAIARLSVAHRREMGDLGAAFRADTDPAAIDLSGPLDFNGNPMGQWLAGHHRRGRRDQRHGGSEIRADLRQHADRAGRARLPPAPGGIPGRRGAPGGVYDSRGVDVRYEVRRSGTVVASATTRLTFGPSDGLISEPLAPVAPPVATEGDSVVVHYDLTGLRALDAPALIISGIAHWSPFAAPLFHEDTSIPLKAAVGNVTIPASAFRGGAGLYGIAIHPQASFSDIGQVAVIRIAPRRPGRPDAPALAAGSGSFGHFAVVTRAAPQFSVRWDASAAGDGAVLEFSAPAPTLRASYNTYSNANGSRPDGDGVDSASTLTVALPGVAGTKTFNALDLGLPTGVFYNVRVLGTRGGAVSGEASPSSALELDDVVVGDGFITSFDLSGDTSLVASARFDAGGLFSGSSLMRWSPRAAALGAVIGSDPTGNTVYEVFETDASRKVSLAARWPWFDSMQFIETWDAASGRLLGTANVDAFAQDWLLTARIDPLRHRAAFLAFDPNFAPVLLPFIWRAVRSAPPSPLRRIPSTTCSRSIRAPGRRSSPRAPSPSSASSPAVRSPRSTWTPAPRPRRPSTPAPPPWSPTGSRSTSRTARCSRTTSCSQSPACRR